MSNLEAMSKRVEDVTREFLEAKQAYNLAHSNYFNALDTEGVNGKGPTVGERNAYAEKHTQNELSRLINAQVAMTKLKYDVTAQQNSSDTAGIWFGLTTY